MYKKIIKEHYENDKHCLNVLDILRGDEDENDVQHILDYVYSKKKEIHGLSFQVLLRQAEKRTTKLNSGTDMSDEVDGEDYEVVLDFGDGFRFVRLISEKSYKREGKLMSHCVASYYGRDVDVFSLRDVGNKPHCSIERGKQIKGKGNGCIDPKYVDYIVKFMEEKGMEVLEREMQNIGYCVLPSCLAYSGDKYRDMYVYPKKIDVSKVSIVGDVHTNDDEALRFAASNGHFGIVKYLVENGADVHASDNRALRYSASNGHFEIVKYLVENGADVHTNDNEALRLASGNGHIEIVKYLVENIERENLKLI